MSWETVATFNSAIDAELAKNALEAQGIAALVVADETADNAWSRNSAGGGIKLCVASHDLGRAELILELKPEALATDAEIEAAFAERPEVAAQLNAAPEPFDDPESDRVVQRAFITAVLGLLFLPARFVNPTGSIIAFDLPALTWLCVPLQLYSLFLLATLRWSDRSVRSSNRWKVWTALGVNVPLWTIIVVPLLLMAGALDDPDAPKWKNTRFAGFDNHVMTVDFAEDYGYDTHDKRSALGPFKVRSFGVAHKDRHFGISIESLPADLTPADAEDALKKYVSLELAGPKLLIESDEPTRFGNHPARDVSLSYNDQRTGSRRFRRANVALVERHFLYRYADLPDNARDGSDVRRFFDSARLH